MSNNQYNLDPSSNFNGNMNNMGSQPGVNAEKRLPEGMPSVSAPPASTIPRNEGDSQYNMGSQNAANNYSTGYINQNQPNNQPAYSQPGMQTNQTSFNQESPGMGVSASTAQHPPISSGMMGASNLSSNQPSIGQRNYQSYPQPGYNGSQPSGQAMNQNVGGMASSGGMNQNYMSGGAQPSMQSIAPVSVPNPNPGFNTSQGEKTYEPGALNTSSGTGRQNFVELLGISLESQQEFDKKVVLCKQYKQTDVFAAIQVKNEEDGLKIVRHLHKQGVDLTTKDTLDQSALFYASRDGKPNILSFLIECGCSANNKDQYGQTPIYYGARDNRVDICQKLIEFGADVNNEDMHNQTCMFYAAKQGNIDICAKLLEAGANINHTDNKRQTPLHWAQRSRKAEMVDWLISNGASPITRKAEKKKTTKIKRNNNIRKSQKYVLTRFVNGQWLPLTEDDFKKLEEVCPDVAKIIKNPAELESLALPEVPENMALYDHWEKPALRIMQTLWRCEGSWIFQNPVDAEAWGIADYHKIISHPMDFTTIKGKLKENKYKNIDEFESDVHLVFDNCIKYNGEANQYSLTANKIRKEFTTQLKCTFWG